MQMFSDIDLYIMNLTKSLRFLCILHKYLYKKYKSLILNKNVKMKKLYLVLLLFCFALNLKAQKAEIAGGTFYVNDVLQNEVSIIWKTSMPTHGTIVVVGPSYEYKIEEEKGYRTYHRTNLSKLEVCNLYYYYLVVYNEKGNKYISNKKETFTTGGCKAKEIEDDQAPSDIEEVSIQKTDKYTYFLQWTESIDNKELAGYYVWGYNSMGEFKILDIVDSKTFEYKFQLDFDAVKSKNSLDSLNFYIQPYDVAGNFAKFKLAKTAIPLSVNCQIINTIKCAGENSASILITASGGVPPYTNVGLFENLAAGSYKYEVYDSQKSTQICEVKIEEPSSLITTCTTVHPISKFGHSDGIILIEATGGVQPYAGIGYFSNLSAGIKKFTTTDQNGCNAICSVELTQPSECPTLSTTQNKFSSIINPTGDPIGGGKCYSKIIKQDQATYVVNNKQEFLDALARAKTGEIIYIPEIDTIDLTGSKNLIIPGGVTIASNRGQGESQGGMITYSSFWPQAQYIAMFVTGGINVRITGLRIQGPNPEIWDHDNSLLYANAIRTLHEGIEIDNVEAWAWDKWFLYLYVANKAYIHHNYIHHTQRAGYGYPIWCGGSGSEVNAITKIYANMFEAARHCIASSGHRNSWEAKYNVILNHQLYVNFDRHQSGNSGIGGKNTTLMYNLDISAQDRNVGFAYPDTLAGGSTLIANNYFKNPSNNTGGCGNVYDLKDTVFYGGKVEFKGNHFNSEGMILPKAIISTDKAEGLAPLTIYFDGGGSYDPDSNDIVEYYWRFADGDYSGNELRTSNGKYTFQEPGVYTIGLFVKNTYGVPSEIAQKTIVVNPTSGKYILSCWIKDSYPYEKSERYFKQILVDNQVVWSEDVSFDEGWQHIVLDISSFGGPNSKHKIAFRLYSKNGVPVLYTDVSEIFMWVDEVWVFGSTEIISASNYSLENLKMYPPFNQAFYYPTGYKSNTSTAVTTEEARGGEKSFRLRFGLGGIIVPGQWGELYKYVTFK